MQQTAKADVLYNLALDPAGRRIDGFFSPGGFDATLEKWTTQGIYAQIRPIERHGVERQLRRTFERLVPVGDGPFHLALGLITLAEQEVQVRGTRVLSCG